MPPAPEDDPVDRRAVASFAVACQRVTRGRLAAILRSPNAPRKLVDASDLVDSWDLVGAKVRRVNSWIAIDIVPQEIIDRLGESRLSQRGAPRFQVEVALRGILESRIRWHRPG